MCLVEILRFQSPFYAKAGTSSVKSLSATVIISVTSTALFLEHKKLLAKRVIISMEYAYVDCQSQ